ncbi:MAG: fumarylacetoacetate hydrolase family protein [Vulcanimicrobiaceae bacterium]
MKYVTYRHGDRAHPGVLDADSIRRIACRSMREFIALEASERASRITAETIPLASVALDAPVVPERNVFCVGRNYLEHAKEGARAAGRELKLPDVPTFFTKAPTAIAAPAATLQLQSRLSSEYDFEAELAVIIGQRCRDVAVEHALSVIFGYTCLNDITARDRQRAHIQWFKGKSFDDTCPVGPWIISADEIADPQSLGIHFRLNGVEKQASTTSQMIFPIARIIAELSAGMTLLPGDIIATGTPDGDCFARVPPEFLRNGDRMEVEIEHIGTLHNTVALS